MRNQCGGYDPNSSTLYEVYNPESKKYKAPKNGKKKTVLPPSIFLILFLFIGAGITYGFFSYTKTEIYLFDFNIEYAMLDDDKIFLDGNAGDHKRLLLNEIKKGKHLIYYDVSPYVRYYSLIDVERGVNLIDPEFKISRTPYFEFKTSLDDGLKFTSNKDKIFSYYNENKELITQTISCNIVIDKKIEDNIIKYISSWELFIDGQPYKQGIEEFQQEIDSKEYNRGDWISYEKDNIYIVSSKQFSRLDQYEIEIMFGWY